MDGQTLEDRVPVEEYTWKKAGIPIFIASLRVFTHSLIGHRQFQFTFITAIRTITSFNSIYFPLFLHFFILPLLFLARAVYVLTIFIPVLLVITAHQPILSYTFPFYNLAHLETE